MTHTVMRAGHCARRAGYKGKDGQATPGEGGTGTQDMHAATRRQFDPPGQATASASPRRRLWRLGAVRWDEDGAGKPVAATGSDSRGGFLSRGHGREPAWRRRQRAAALAEITRATPCKPKRWILIYKGKASFCQIVLANPKYPFYFARMIQRRTYQGVLDALGRQAAVALIGPRQVGKTTLAHEIADGTEAVYLDLEARADRDKLADPALFLKRYEDRLVVLDEIHRVPELFQELRGLIDSGRRRGKRTGRFLILGSASMDLLRQSGESLAGRIEYVEMNPLDVLEVDADPDAITALWVRGGFPDSFLAGSDADSLTFRQNFIRTYLERDVPQFGRRIPAGTLERLWTMLAHSQGAMLNASKLAAGLSITAPTVSNYVDLLIHLLLVRRLPPYSGNVKKRLVKSPRVYIRDTGIVHALLGIEDYNALAGHPVVGPSWEGFVIENLLAAAPRQTKASFYRTSAGAEIDLLLELPGSKGLWAIEIKRGLSARPSKGFHNACEDLKPGQAFIVHAGEDRYPVTGNIEAIGLREMAETLRDSVA